MRDPQALKRIEAIYAALEPVMDERMRRQWAAAEAQAYGWGGVRWVGEATHLSPNTIRKGIGELKARADDPGWQMSERVRQEGGRRAADARDSLRLIQDCKARWRN